MTAKNALPPLSEAQLEIMNVVWDAGEVSVTAMWQTLAERRRLARNTVQTLMSRLEEKGWLRHREDGNAFHYRAAIDRSRARRQLARRLVDTVFAGSAEGLVLALIDGGGISPDEAARIRRLIRKEENRR